MQTVTLEFPATVEVTYQIFTDRRGNIDDIGNLVECSITLNTKPKLQFTTKVPQEVEDTIADRYWDEFCEAYFWQDKETIPLREDWER